jgi:hypothetical protein
LSETKESVTDPGEIMKLTTVSAFLIGCSLSLALGHSAIGKENDEDTDDSESQVKIEKTVLARKVEDGFEPVKSFKPSDTFSVLVFLNEAKIGTRLKAIWIIVRADGMKNSQKILEKNIEITPEAIKGVEEPNRINFNLTHDDLYPRGDYKTEIYLNGELAKTVQFKIE